MEITVDVIQCFSSTDLCQATGLFSEVCRHGLCSHSKGNVPGTRGALMGACDHGSSLTLYSHVETMHGVKENSKDLVG